MIILSPKYVTAARELCDNDLRSTMELSGNLASKALENRTDENDPTLRWVCRSHANLKWTVEYALSCAAESLYRFEHRSKVPASVYALLMMDEIEAGEPDDMPEDIDKWRKHYADVIAPKSIRPKRLWTKRYPPDWMAPFIYPNAKLS